MEAPAGLPRVTDTARSNQLQLNDGRQLTLLHVPKLNLHVISDRGQFGPNWIEVDVHNRIYTTRFLAGSDEDLNSALARRFAQCIIGKAFKSPLNSACDDQN